MVVFCRRRRVYLRTYEHVSLALVVLLSAAASIQSGSSRRRHPSDGSDENHHRVFFFLSFLLLGRRSALLNPLPPPPGSLLCCCRLDLFSGTLQKIAERSWSCSNLSTICIILLAIRMFPSGPVHPGQLAWLHVSWLAGFMAKECTLPTYFDHSAGI